MEKLYTPQLMALNEKRKLVEERTEMEGGLYGGASITGNLFSVNG